MYLSGNKPVIEHLRSKGIWITENQIDFNGRNGSSLHPIVHELNSRGEQAIQLLSLLESLYVDGGVVPDHLEIEYIPILDNSVYFRSRQMQRTKYHSSLVIVAFEALRDRTIGLSNPFGERGGVLFPG
jgi:hypothetical protein